MKKPIFLIAILVTFFLSCSESITMDEEQELVSLKDQQNLPQEYSDALDRNGFDISQISIVDGEIVYQGDIVISKSLINNMIKNKEKSYYAFNNLLSPANYNINVLIDSDFNPIEQGYIIDALENYNNIPKFAINFTWSIQQVTTAVLPGANLPIAFSPGRLFGSFPVNGEPQFVELDFDEHDEHVNNPTVESRIAVVMHEIGHNLGLAHSHTCDQSGGNTPTALLPCRQCDYNSNMTQTSGQQFILLTAEDIKSCQLLYPDNFSSISITSANVSYESNSTRRVDLNLNVGDNVQPYKTEIRRFAPYQLSSPWDTYTYTPCWSTAQSSEHVSSPLGPWLFQVRYSNFNNNTTISTQQYYVNVN